LLQASGHKPLQKAAGYLKDMKNFGGKLMFVTINIGGKDCALDLIRNFAKKKMWSSLINLAGSGPAAAVLIGVEIGVAVGTTFNNTFLNIDGIYQAAYKTQWCAEAAEKYFYNVFVKNAHDFYLDPVNKRERMKDVCFVYCELTGASYSAFGKMYREIDNAWVNQISQWFVRDDKNAKAAQSCDSIAKMMREYLDYALSSECIRNYTDAY